MSERGQDRAQPGWMPGGKAPGHGACTRLSPEFVQDHERGDPPLRPSVMPPFRPSRVASHGPQGGSGEMQEQLQSGLDPVAY